MAAHGKGTPAPVRVLRLGGVIEEWNDERGFGFIRPEHGGRRVFAHISEFRQDGPGPRVGERVTYVLAPGSAGRLQAKDVTTRRPRRLAPGGGTPPHEAPPLTAEWHPAHPAWGLLGTVLTAHVLFLTFAISYWHAPWQVFLYSGLASVVAFFTYAYDKRAAVLGQWRISESVMQSVALLGGWPGALVAQQVLRHKNRKRSFQIRFWIYAVLHEIVLGVIMWRYGFFVGLLWNAVGRGTWAP